MNPQVVSYWNTVLRETVHLKTQEKCLLVRAASPASVIWRASKLSDLRDVNPDKFFKLLSVTKVHDRSKFSRLVKPGWKIRI